MNNVDGRVGLIDVSKAGSSGNSLHDHPASSIACRSPSGVVNIKFHPVEVSFDVLSEKGMMVSGRCYCLRVAAPDSFSFLAAHIEADGNDGAVEADTDVLPEVVFMPDFVFFDE